MRRIHLPKLTVGELPLSAEQGHHARHVLRLAEGTEVDLFDDAGRTGRAILRYPGGDGVVAEVTTVTEPAGDRRTFTVAAAVPKGDRAEWMVEKLSELGAAAFIPLRTKRSVVHPEGANKYERWRRIATEAAKQSKRVGVMGVRELTDLTALLSTKPRGWYFSTAPGAVPMRELLMRTNDGSDLTVFIGPEGGWTGEDLAALEGAGLTAASLGPTVLRVETAAVVAAGLAAALLDG